VAIDADTPVGSCASQQLPSIGSFSWGDRAPSWRLRGGTAGVMPGWHSQHGPVCMHGHVRVMYAMRACCHACLNVRQAVPSLFSMDSRDHLDCAWISAGACALHAWACRVLHGMRPVGFACMVLAVAFAVLCGLLESSRPLGLCV